MRYVFALLLILYGAWLTDMRLDVQGGRITELECALAQAQALLAEESLTTSNLGLDSP